MATYKDVENFSALFDEKFKKTSELILQGETHLDNLAEGFLEADRVIRNIPTADVVPREEVEKIFEEIDSTIELVCAMTGLNITIFGKYAELKKKYIGDKQRKEDEGE